jgi:Domain of unknown function (DUF4278)
MKLVYRGNTYESNPVAVDLVESSTVGHYRGQTYHLTYPRHIPVPQPALDLKYRGVAYHRDAQGNVTAVEPSARSQAASQPAYLVSEPSVSRKAKLAEAAKIHHETISRRLQHRLEVARQKGDQTLIQQLEHEMQQIA